MATERTMLAQMLWELKEELGLSVDKLAERSEGGISGSTLHDVMSGKYKSLSDDTITGIAKILKISESHVIAAFRNRPFSLEEKASEERARLWEMYSDIPPQCQKDVMDLLSVLQRNHSISTRQRKRSDRRKIAAAAEEQPGNKLGPNTDVDHTQADEEAA